MRLSNNSRLLGNLEDQMTVLLKRHTTHFLFVCALFIVTSSVTTFALDTTSFNLLDAGQRGAFNVGDANAEATFEFDAALGRDVLKIDAAISPSAAAGIWFKDFPAELNAQTADIVEFGARVDDPDILGRISANIELKGDSGIQVIKLPAGVDWLFVQELIDWNRIGDLKEVVIVIAQTGGNEPVSAGLYVDLNFKTLALSQKIATSIPAKLGGVFLCSLLLAAVAAILRRLFKVSCREVSAERTQIPALCQNVLYGLCAAMIAIIVFHIYSLGVMSFLDVGWNFLFVALAGGVVVQLLKFAATGRHLRPSQVFQSVFIVGLLAATSGATELLQAPSAWIDIIAINKLTAAVACLLYLTANAYLLSSSGSMLRPISSTLLTGTPYLFGWLLTIESPKLLETLGGFVTANLLAEHPEILKWLGQVVVIFLFNEAITNGISFLITRKALRGARAHLFILFISVFVITSPLIAGLGSGANIAALPAIAVFFIVIITTVFSHAGLWAQVYLLTGMIMDGMHGIEPSWITIRDHTSSGIKKGMVYSGTFMGILYGLKIVSDIPLSQWALSSHSMIALLLFGTLIFPLIKTIIETFDGSHGFFLRASYSYRNITLYARGAVIGLGTAYGFGNGMVDMDMPIRITYGLGVGLLASAGVSIIRDAVFMYRGKGRIQVWRLYFTDAMLGGFIGAAIAFYLDSSQVPVVAEKIRLYTSAGLPTSEYSVYPLINKWGHITLGNVTGGVKLFFNEALAGVINWSVAAWLFAINRAFLTALFQRDKAPIKLLFSKEGFVYLIEHTIQVLRWGLWMSPIINTFLRMMGQATWYNQDGAIRTLVVVYQNLTMGSEQFQAWSLRIFIYVLAYVFFRILIWLVWGVAEYVRMTGDESILDEMTSYLRSELPLDPLPKGKHGFATFYFRSTQEDSVYDHCIKSIDLVFDKRMGRNGLPLILTGDWNDGLDEIGSEGRGESVWLGFFLYYILDNMLDIIAKREGDLRRDHYLHKMEELKSALEKTWRDDRYLRAIHDDGTEIGIKGSGVWEIDALTAAWAVISDINPQRGRIVFQTAINELENDVTVLLGTPPLREDTTPYLGRSSHYPEGVRENGMYCHGVQWLIKASRILAEQCHAQDETDKADEYRRTCYRLWRKITPVAHVTADQIENYGGQPNKQPADMLTTYDNGRMIWNGYTGAAAWLFRQGLEGVIGADLVGNEVILPPDIYAPRGKLKIKSLHRNIENSPLNRII